MRHLLALTLATATLLSACGGSGMASDSQAAPSDVAPTEVKPAAFDADSAYAYVQRQVDFGPRVPNTAAHAATAEWLASELRRHGAQVATLPAELKAFDGTTLKATNILASYNPEAKERILLVAHWDCRPWADEDPDEANHSKPVDGANDGASGVGVLLEIARQLGIEAPAKGVDILLVDAEDWGTEGRDDSWALGAKHFVDNPPEGFIRPKAGVLLDMVGGNGAQFRREQFSQYYSPELVSDLWSTAAAIGHGNIFSNEPGGAITDDHLQFIRAGIPMIDIIEFHPDSGFNPRWHTAADNMEGIDAATLGAVGETVMTWLRNK